MNAHHKLFVELSAFFAFALAGCSPSEFTPVDRRLSGLYTGTTDPKDFALFASNSIAISDQVSITGRTAVTAASPATVGQTLADGVRISVGTFSNVGHTSSRETLAYTAIFRYGVDLHIAHVDTATFDDHRAGYVKEHEFPTFSYFPRAREVFPGTQELFVTASSTVTISSTTSYARLEVGPRGVLNLQAGNYEIRELILLEGARITALGAVELRVKNRALAKDRSRVTLASGLTADEFRIEVLGKNGGAGLPGSVPRALDIGEHASLRAVLFAPHGTLRLGDSTQLIGTAVARDIRVDRGAAVTHEDGLRALTGSAPLAYRDEFDATEDQTLEVAAPGILANDLHPSYAPITATLVQGTVNGTVALAADGAFDYQPNPNFEGDDTFTYYAERAGVHSATTTVTIHVSGTNDVPVIDSYPSSTSFVGHIWEYSVACSDADIGDAVEISLDDAPSGMSVAGNLISFAPHSGHVGLVEFDVYCTDTSSAADVQHVRLNVLSAPAIEQFVVYAKNSIYFRGTAVDGSVGVFGTGSGTFLQGARATVGDVGIVGQTSDAHLFAESVRLLAGSHVQDLYTDNIIFDASLARGEQFDFPAMPAFPSVSSVSPGTGTLTLAANTQTTISSTRSWSTFEIGAQACLYLQPGIHHVGQVNVANNGCIAALGPAELRISGRLSIGNFAYLGPAAGVSSGPEAFRIEVNGTDSGPGLFSGTPAVETRNRSSIIGSLIAPNGTALFGWRTSGWGLFAARDIIAQDYTLFFRGASGDENHPPSIVSTPSTSVLEGSTYSYSIEVSDDDDGDTHEYFLDLGPSGMTVGQTSGQVAWVPTNAHVGSHSVRFRARDSGGLEDTQTFQLTVVNINNPPVFTSSPDTSAAEDELYTHLPTATDADGTTPTLSLVEGPAGLSFGVAGISWTPSQAQVGTHTVVLAASDGALSVTQSFQLTVSATNDTPAFAMTPPATAVEDELYTFVLRATDPDPGDSLTFTLLSAPADMELDSELFSVAWTPGDDDLGPHTVSIQVEDTAGATATLEYTLTVENANDAPSFSPISPMTATENEELLFTVSAVDPDPSDSVEYSLDSGPEGMELDGNSVTWTPGDDQVGTFSAVIRATDSHGAIATQQVSITVQNTNDSPIFDSDPIETAKEDTPYQYFARAHDIDAGDSLTFSFASGTPTGLSVHETSGDVSWPSPVEGEYELTLQVTDGTETVEQTFTLVVERVNDPPTIINWPPPPTATQHQFYSFDPHIYDDQIGWTISLDVAPQGMTAFGNVISWTPDHHQLGDYSMIVRVTDSDGDFEVRSFVVTVLDENDAPQFITEAPTTILENRLYTYQARATDPDGDTVTYSLGEHPHHLTVDPQTGVVTWRPATQQIGEHLVELIARDGSLLFTVQSWTLTVGGEPCTPGDLSSARCSALAWAHAVRQDGVPLGGVTVTQQGVSSNAVTTDEATGLATVGGGSAGEYEWLFSANGLVPVFGRAELVEENISWLSVPRMAPLYTLGNLESIGGTFSDVDDRVRIDFPLGAVSTPSAVHLAVLDGQSLPGYLPLGWSPAGAVWFEVDGGLQDSVYGRFRLPSALAATATLVVAEWDATAAEWIALETIHPNNTREPGVSWADATLPDAGGYAILLADAETPAPTLNSALPSSTLSAPVLDSLSAAGEAVPEYQMASEHIDEVTATACVTLATGSPLPSGIVAPARIFESYSFADGRNSEVPFLDVGVAVYRYPPRPNTPAFALAGTFPLRPRYLLSLSEVADVHQRVDVVSALSFAGTPVDEHGGVIAQDGIILTIPEDAFTGPTLVSISTLPIGTIAVETAGAVLAFRVDWSGQIVSGPGRINFEAEVAPNQLYVLARQELNETRVGWAPVARYYSDESGALISDEPGLPGITTSGSYALFGIDVPEGLVRGVVENPASQPIPDALVEIEGRPWLVRTDALGEFATLAFAGTVDARAQTIGTSDNGAASGTLDHSGGVWSELELTIVVGPQAPRIIRTEPVAGSIVPVVTAIEVFFSEPIVAASVPAGAIVVSDEEGAIEGTQSLRPNRRSLAFFPTRPLKFDTDYEVEVSSAISDGQNLLSESRTFEFHTELARVRSDLRARLTSYAPGFANPPCEQAAFTAADTCVVGSAGIADPNVAVILVNEDTGVTVSTHSKADGSFNSFIPGGTEDLLSAVFINRNGTRLTVPLELQHLADGSVALYAGGGVVEAENPIAEENLQLVIEPGAIPRRAVFKMTGRTAAEMGALNDGVTSAQGTLLFGSTIEYDGAPLRASADVRFPIDENDFPMGTDLEEVGFLLTEVRKIRVNGENRVVYEVLDRMEYEEGALVTHSFPMIGLVFQLLAPELAQRVNNFVDPLHHLAIIMTSLTPTAVAGQVIACEPFNADGTASECSIANSVIEAGASFETSFNALPLGGRRLSGAIVAANSLSSVPSENPGPGRTGTIGGGQFVAVSNAQGRYSIALPFLADTSYVLHATHHHFPGTAAAAPVDFSSFSIIGGAAYANLIFDAPSPEDAALRGPSLTIAHTPARPTPFSPTVEQPEPEVDQRAEIRFTAQHPDQLPNRFDLWVQSINPLELGPVDFDTDVVIEGPTFVDDTAQNRRIATYYVRSRIAGLVRLGAEAHAGNEVSRLVYPVFFGGAMEPLPNETPAPEPDDHTGPWVEQTWPPDGAIAVATSSPITIYFNEPISRDVLAHTLQLELSPSAGRPVATLSGDQRTLQLIFPAMLPGVNYTWVAPRGALSDLRGKGFDQDPSNETEDGFELHFTTAVQSGTAEGALGMAELGLGGGAVVHGIYAYVLDKTAGALRIYDLSNPSAPWLRHTEYLAGGYPRDLVLIPNYSYVRPLGDLAQSPCGYDDAYWERDWAVGFDDAGIISNGCASLDRTVLVIAGGLYNPRFSSGGATNGLNIGPRGGQYMRVLDVTDLQAIKTVATSFITVAPTSSVGRLKWSPPAVSYLEWSEGVSTVSAINLQKYIFGLGLSGDQFSHMPETLLGAPGADLNDDGDFLDQNEVLPMPGRPINGIVGYGTAGKELQVHALGSDQRIQDYDFYGRTLFVGAAMGPGRLLDANGLPLNISVPPTYQTLAAEGFEAFDLTIANAAHAFVDVTTLETVAYLPDTVLRINGERELMDLALVGARTLDQGADVARIFLLNVTNVLAPELIGDPSGIALAASAGVIQGIERDPLMPSMLRAITSNSIVLLDIDRLASTAHAGAGHPAIAGVIAGVGSTHFGHGASTYGVHVLSDVNRVAFTGPQLFFVSFPSQEDVVSPRDARGPAELRELFSEMQRETDLRPIRLRQTNGSYSSEVVPGAPDGHFHVLIHAPGSSGAELSVMLESLNEAGYPLANRQAGFAPVRALTVRAQGRGNLAAPTGAAAIQPLQAVRLSEDLASPYYNVYLSEPFALVYEKVSAAELANLRVLNGRPRQLYHGGFAVRASLDPETPNGHILKPFASDADHESGEIRLGSAVRATSFMGHRILGPNPGPIGGSIRAPGTQEMVAAHNGELQIDRVDFELPGRRMPIEFERSYTGQDLFHGGFGPGWDFNYNQRLIELRPENVPDGKEIDLVRRGNGLDSIAGSGDILFYDGEGHAIRYALYSGPDTVPSQYNSDPLIAGANDWRPNVDRWYLPEEGVFDALVHFRTGQFARLTPDGTQYWYNGLGRLERIYHRYEQNRIDLAYTSRGELRRIVDRSVNAPRYLELGYYRASSDPLYEAQLDERIDVGQKQWIGRIARIRDYSSPQREVGYRYDADGRLEYVLGIEVSNAGPGGFTGIRTIQYSWGPLGSGITGVIDGSEDAVAAFGATVGTDGIVRSGRGADGRTTIDVNHDNLASAIAGATVDVTTSDQAQTQYTFNGFGLPTRVLESGSGASAEETKYEYVSRTLLEKVTFQKGNWVKYTYDTLNPNLRSRGNIVAIERSAGPQFGNRIIDRTLNYDPRYNLLEGRQEDFAGNPIFIDLENEGRDISRTRYSTFREETHHYNNGQLASKIDVNGVEEYFTYHSDTGFLTSHRQGDVETRFEYQGCRGSSWGLPCSEIPELSAAIAFEYNEMGHQISARRGSYVVETGHNPNGDPREVIQTFSVTPSGQYAESRTYDQQGFLLSTLQQNVETEGSPDSLLWQFSPDSMRRLQTVTTPQGETETYTYDHRGRVKSKTIGQYVETFTYDGNGNLETHEIGDAVERRHYDGFDRLRRIEHFEGGETLLDYDDNDHLIRREIHDPVRGRQSNYVVSLNDELGRPLAWQEGGSQFSAEYHQNAAGVPGPLATVLHGPEGDERVRTHDSGGRTLSDEIVGFYRRVHDLDDEGRVEFMHALEGDAAGPVAYRDDFGSRYGYDALGYLDEEKDVGEISRVTYENRLDGLPTAANVALTESTALRTQTPRTVLGEPRARITPSGVETRMTFDDQRRVREVGVGTGAHREYAYDSSARLRVQTERDGSEHNFDNFDARNRPQAITLPGGGSIAAGYDLKGRLSSQTVIFGGRTVSESFDYDVLDRVRRARFGSNQATFDYDELGTMTRGVLTYRGEQYIWSVAPYLNGAPRQLIYPTPAVTVEQGRSSFGRLNSMSINSGSLLDSMSYATADDPATMDMGAIERQDTYDHRRRLKLRRYLAGAQVIAEQRYQYDGADREIGRQSIHRGGRTDLYSYDVDSRLERAELGARPEWNEGSIIAWPVNSGGVAGTWRAGAYGRGYQYDSVGEDRLISTTRSDRVGEPAPRVAATLENPDSMGHVDLVDSTDRARDALGNTTRTELLTGVADLEYDGLSRLRSVRRADGSEIHYDYRSDGPLVGREVTCASAVDCVPSSRVYIYDGLRLLAEYEVSNGRELRARYYYADEEDIPFAADFLVGQTLVRHYFVTDRVGSIIGVLDAQGAWIERVSYDPWGRPTIEPADIQGPVLSSIEVDGDGNILLAFTEPVLPRLGAATGEGIITTFDPGDILVVSDGLDPIEGAVQLLEDDPAHARGTVLRFVPASPILLGMSIELSVEAGRLLDGWSNGNAAIFQNLTFEGGVRYTGPPQGTTMTAPRDRSLVGNALLFQAHLYDYDADLIHMRARVYDPHTGMFLSLDPEGYEDSPNLYAGLGHDTINHRDPTGAAKKVKTPKLDAPSTGKASSKAAKVSVDAKQPARAAKGGPRTPPKTSKAAKEGAGTDSSVVGQTSSGAEQGALVRRTAKSPEEVSKASTAERTFVKEFFTDRGYDVVLMGGRKSGADIQVVGGPRYELKQLTSANPSKIASRIKEALVEQKAGNVIIDARGTPLSNVQIMMGYKEAVRKGFVGDGKTVRLISRHGLDVTF